MSIFITSDSHFGHKNIIQYENRPFADIEEMNSKMIELWNQTVKPDDIVYHLGDVAPFKKETYITAIVKQLNGDKRLILGNHDREEGGIEKFLRIGFTKVYDNPIIIENFIILSHEPMYMPSNNDTPYRWIFGHVHGDEAYKTLSHNSACACVERWNYKPINLKEIVEEWRVLDGE